MAGELIFDDHEDWRCPECGVVDDADGFEVIADGDYWSEDVTYGPPADRVMCLNCNAVVFIWETEGADEILG